MKQHARSMDPPLIQEFLRSARENYTGEPPPATGHNKARQSGLSQMAIAQRLGMSLTIVNEWERGARPIPPQRVPDVAAAYGLTPAQGDLLWRIVTGQIPAEPGEPVEDAATGWTQWVRDQQNPALAVDPAWTVLESNQAWNHLFQAAGQAQPKNLMRFILLSPYARTLCGEWESGWADPFTHELRMEVQNDTHHSELHVIAEELHGIPELTALWHAASESSRSAMVHDGKVRLLKPPASSRLHRVRLLVSSPAHDPRRRFITLQPTPEINMPLTPSTQRELDVPGTDGWPPVPGSLVWMPLHTTAA